MARGDGLRRPRRRRACIVVGAAPCGTTADCAVRVRPRAPWLCRGRARTMASATISGTAVERWRRVRSCSKRATGSGGSPGSSPSSSRACTCAHVCWARGKGEGGQGTPVASRRRARRPPWAWRRRAGHPPPRPACLLAAAPCAAAWPRPSASPAFLLRDLLLAGGGGGGEDGACRGLCESRVSPAHCVVAMRNERCTARPPRRSSVPSLRRRQRPLRRPHRGRQCRSGRRP